MAAPEAGREDREAAPEDLAREAREAECTEDRDSHRHRRRAAEEADAEDAL